MSRFGSDGREPTTRACCSARSSSTCCTSTAATCSTSRCTSGSTRWPSCSPTTSTPRCGCPASARPTPEQAAEVLADGARRRPRGRRRQGAGRRLRGRPARRGVAEGQAGAHPRPRRARRGVGLRPAHREAVEHPPRRPRPRRRRAGDGRQDVQGHDRRAAGLADRAPSPSTPASSPTGACELRPELVVEIAVDGAQRSTRYPGGVALRFARVLRYRPDKTPAEADTIDAVRALLAGS